MTLTGPKKEIVICGIPFGTSKEREALLRAKEAGATAIQIYTFWKDFEPIEKGNFDWSFYDREVELIRETGLKYVPFILMGPKYASPSWWLNSKEHKGLRCLEHHRTSPIESIWNVKFRKEITRVLEAFAKHYLPMDVLESIQPGICGDYGEAIFPVHGNWPGDYHTHQGYWCDDEEARKDFQTAMLKKYKELDHLNRTWKTNYQDIKEVVPVLPHEITSRVALFDMIEWYRKSMTDFAGFWLQECRRIFPQLPVYLCTGGNEDPEHGSSFSSQAKVAAKYKCGLRLTNEGNKFYENFYWTALTKSACDYYGAYLGLEPVGPVTKKGVATRIFSSAAFGNRQIFHYYSNLFDEENQSLPAALVSKQYSNLISEDRGNCEIAIMWPSFMATLQGGTPEILKKSLIWMRKRYDCLPVNEEMILDGALAKYKILVIPVSGFTSEEVLLKIVSWVRTGGVLLAAGNMRNLNLQDVWEYNVLFGITKESDEVAGHCSQYVNDNADFKHFSALQKFSACKAWTNLDSDTVLLSSTVDEVGYSDTRTWKCSTVFYKKNAEGIAIYYHGLVEFEEDEESLFSDQGAFLLLLKDLITQFTTAIDLSPTRGEIARAMIHNKKYSLTEVGEIIEVLK